MANFKISLRELPDHGNFRVTVKAARYDDGLLLDAGAPIQENVKAQSIGSRDWPRAGRNRHDCGRRHLSS